MSRERRCQLGHRVNCKKNSVSKYSDLDKTEGSSAYVKNTKMGSSLEVEGKWTLSSGSGAQATSIWLSVQHAWLKLDLGTLCVL